MEPGKAAAFFNSIVGNNFVTFYNAVQVRFPAPQFQCYVQKTL